jgi:hypothetical protein
MVVACFQKTKRRKSSFTTELALWPAVSLSRDAKKRCLILKNPVFCLSPSSVFPILHAFAPGAFFLHAAIATSP